MSASSLSKLAAIALLSTVLALPMPAPATAQQVVVIDSTRPTDLIQDQPGYTTALYNVVTGMASWTWGMVSSGFSSVTPPSPSDIADTMSSKDQDELVKLLDTAGYKLKEIDTEVGLIPGVTFAFGMIRQLSEADLEYLESELERSRFLHPGLATRIKRAIVETVLTINSGGTYNVSELHVTLLPLPAVQFSVAPVVAPLGDEASALMRAIQRVDRNVRNLAGGVHKGTPIETSVKLAAPTQPRNGGLIMASASGGSTAGSSLAGTSMAGASKTGASKAGMSGTDALTPAGTAGEWISREFFGMDLGQWLFGGAMLLIVIGLMIELVRRLIDDRVATITPVTFAMFAASGAVWACLAYVTQSWLVLAGAALLFVTAVALLLQRLLPSSNAPAESNATASTK
ncbi:MAG: hypothetical protein KJ904_06890 [Alphaproteobacteria bacterium]|nr:hypothetical protein [Alphaproteobacteria bacterium]MBU0797358.1 hypothetical protein [Alphaproteobacteria bacterium]MBU0886874.1 hypothetical protein [Alphaproteobacteria bacterium]MBU1812383.1 hypothetical protein [Alphaproteobacteria bacterium]